MFFGHSLATTGCKSAISASSLALGSTPWSLRREQYGSVTASYSIEFEGSQKSLLRAVRLTSRRCWHNGAYRHGNAPHIPNETDARPRVSDRTVATSDQ